MTDTNPLPVEVTPEDYEIAKRANVLWGQAINGPHVSVIAAAMGRLSASIPPLQPAEAVKLADDGLDEFLNEWSDCGNLGWCHYEGKCTRHNREEYRAALKGLRQSPPVQMDDVRNRAIEEAAKALLAQFDIYLDSDLNHECAHSLLVRYELWGALREALSNNTNQSNGR